MRSRPLHWFLFSLLCLVGAFFMWQWGDRVAATRNAAPASRKDALILNVPLLAANSRLPIVPPQLGKPGSTNMTPRELAAAKRAKLLSYRLSNTSKSLKELMHDDKAVLLENALIDTAQSTHLAIPDSLRSHGDPGSYIVQANGPINDSFRASLNQAGASVISYIPNNAYLVRASASVANALASDPQTQSVLPYEPYYKLKSSLLESTVEQQPLPGNSALNVLLFADNSAATISQLQGLGAQIVGHDTSPFGPVVKVLPQAGSVAAIAGLPGVEEVEELHRRASANDLTRVIIGESVNAVTNANYLNLNGSNIVVNLNDSGVDATHPDFGTPTRVFAAPSDATALVDTDGHGTHVAGIIAGDGTQSATVTFASGSPTNANFRGKAPLAKVYIQDINFNEPLVPDSALQEGAATNGAYISNNSWGTPEDNTYSIESASYDAAVRDALPGVTGSQPLVYVFAAGNNGFGPNVGDEPNGLDGTADTVISPGTAKNVITVGATELPRFITNQFQVAGVTNAYYYPETDSSNQVAYFSSCGNVGIGIEGDFGRFKPDVVAPGTFVVSTKSGQWDTNAYDSPTNIFPFLFPGVSLAPGVSVGGSVFIPDNGISLSFTIVTNSTSPSPFPALPIFVQGGSVPNVDTGTPSGTIAPGSPFTTNFPPAINDQAWFFDIHNNTGGTVNFDLLVNVVTTNNNDALKALQQLNSKLGAYRYESGTSMATPAVSGMLVLMQQFFEQRMATTGTNNRPSPAMMKALVINGARTLLNGQFQVQNSVNEQGWGLVNLTNSIPAPLTNYPSYTSTNVPGPMVLFDQAIDSTVGNAMYTGQSSTRYIALNNPARNQPLRVTLAWTDPPGNPAAGIKLVNSMQLIVTNLDSGFVYYGNDIGADSIYNNAHTTNASDQPVFDDVNNVQNVFLQPTLDAHYSVTVLAQRVNVNAVTAHPNNVAQDYALVISSGNGRSNTLIMVTNVVNATTETPDITEVTNGIPLMNQEVGASSPLFGTNTIAAPGGGVITLGATNQWHFYIFTNNAANAASFTNVAFATFEPPEQAVPREGVFESGDPFNATRPEADLDLFVSTNALLTNLDISVLTAAVQAGMVSVGQGGTEAVILQTNDGPGTVFYIGVQSEDRMAAQYGFFGIATSQPFGLEGANGSTLYGVPLPETVTVGTAKVPKSIPVFFFEPNSYLVQKVVVTNTITHQLLGDLLGNLSHNGQFVVLNNHTPYSNIIGQTIVYDDSGDGETPNATNSDGPGNLNNFIGTQSSAVWLLNMVDNSPDETGQVVSATMGLSKESDNNTLATVEPGFGDIVSVVAPVLATNMTFSLTFGSGGPLDVFIGDGFIPDQTNFTASGVISAPGGSITLGPPGAYPFTPGDVYYVLVFNPTATAVNNVGYSFTFGLDVNGPARQTYVSAGPTNILDDAVSGQTLTVANNAQIVSVNVGVRINHPRISDLALTLVSPDGTRVLLMENRGNGTTNGAGSSITATNVFPLTTNGNFNVSSNIIETGQTQGTLIVDYNFFSIPDDLQVYYQGNVIYDTTLISGTNEVQIPYSGASTELTIVMNQGNNSNTNTEWEYTASVIESAYSYLTFTDDTNLATIPIKFAVPPFVSTNIGISVPYANAFEASFVGDYTNGQMFEIFTVQTNMVSAVSDPGTAQGGNKFVALGDGSFTGSIPTKSGNNYKLNLAYRGPGIVSWWRGVTNTTGSVLDSISTNNGTIQNNVTYATGFVTTNGGQAFSFPNPGGPNSVQIGDPDELKLTNSLTIDAWVNEAAYHGLEAIFHRGDNRGCLDPYVLSGCLFPSGPYLHIEDATSGTCGVNALSPTLLPLNTWVHEAGTLDGNTGDMKLYIDGVLTVQTSTTQRPFHDLSPGNEPMDAIGNYGMGNNDAYFIGMIDEVSVYSRALSAAEISGIYRKGSAGKFDPTVTGAQALAKAQFSAGTSAPQTFYGQNTNWQVGSVFFKANASTTPVTVTGLEPGMLVDSLALIQLPSDLYYQPEETLDKLKGENANGQWRLELWDNRAGAPAPAGALVSWELSFVFGAQNGTPNVTNTVAANTMDILTIPVPCNALFATNILVSASGPVNIYVNPNTPPTGAPPDVLEINNLTSGTFTLNPPLLMTPCTPYFVGIQNLSATNITYTYQVQFDFSTAAEASLGAGSPPPMPKIGAVKVSSGGVLLQWNAPPNLSYQVQSIPALKGTNTWKSFSNVVTSASGHYSFMDDGSQTGGFGPVRFYRLRSYP